MSPYISLFSGYFLAIDFDVLKIKLPPKIRNNKLVTETFTLMQGIREGIDTRSD